MIDVLFSPRQFQALVVRLDKIDEDVTSIKLKIVPEAGYIDTSDLLQLLHVSNRTAQRWRANGRLPYSKIGEKFYYRVDQILDKFRIHQGSQVESIIPSPQVEYIEKEGQEIACEKCPLFLILNM